MANRLANESSPYLLQHADNPVDWYPWGPEALSLAKEKDRPIFLSIGYSACHWCHVMEHESFEDPGIARILNDNFVSIKVDREERPDLDQIYMNAVMALRGGGGGWPLSVFLTPTQEVFFGGTYWPPRSRMNMPGFDQVLLGVLDAYQSRRDQVDGQSRQITDWLNRAETVPAEADLDRALLETAAQTLEREFDFTHGGFGTAPKFPHAMDLKLLIRLATDWPEHIAPGLDVLQKMVQLNLEKMAKGGIYDQLAGGFARYSVDEYWLVPHFEKMLYDNSLLAEVYIEQSSISGNDHFARIASETLDYLLRELRDDLGGFYSTQDADSDGEEGKFYVWSRSEIVEVLGDELGNLFCQFYNVTEHGNFEGQNILHLTRSIDQFASLHGVSADVFQEQISSARQQLLEVRRHRVWPGLDDKVLTSWNGLAISALSRAAAMLDGERDQNAQYLAAANRAADFILEHLSTADGRLLRTWRAGTAKLNGYLDDYSYFIVALLDLYFASGDENRIDQAYDLTECMIEHFIDQSGGFYFTSDDHERLISRSKSFQDSSLPSGNSMAALALLRLGRLLGRSDWIDLSSRTAKAALSLIHRAPLASGQMLIAIHEILAVPTEWVFITQTEPPIKKLQKIIRGRTPVGTTLVWRCHAHGFTSSHLDPVIAGKVAVDDQPTLYVCQNYACQAPVVGLAEIEAFVEQYLVGAASSKS